MNTPTKVSGQSKNSRIISSRIVSGQSKNSGFSAVSSVLILLLAALMSAEVTHAASSQVEPLKATTQRVGADNAALGVVQDYLMALMSGDVDEVREALSDRLAEKRSSLLGNPNYPGSLRRAYANAEYRITGSEQVSPNRAKVDAELLLQGNQALNVQFVLETQGSGYKIVSEN